MKKFMMTKNEKIGAVGSFLLGLTVVLVQSCGSSGGGSTASTTALSSSACGIDAYGQYSCTGVSGTGGTAAQTLFTACGSSYPTDVAMEALESQGGGEYEVSTVTSSTALDGTPVCQVSFMQLVSYEGARYFLGPNAGINTGYSYSTGVYFYQYDEFAAYATGSYGANSQTDFTDVAGGADDLYGIVSGGSVSSFPIYGQVQIMAFNGGYLYVGANQGYGNSGSMNFSLEVEIQRCVDANGNYHQCANPLSPSFDALL